MEYVISAVSNPDSALGATQTLTSEGDTVTALAVGTEKKDDLLETCISGGAANAYRLMDQDFMGSDTWALSRIYAAFIGKYCPDMQLMIFTSYDPIVPMLAHLMKIQQFCYVTEVGRDDEGIFVKQDYGDEIRKCRVPAGSIISMGDGVNIQYSEKEVDTEIMVLGRKDLELAKNSVGIQGSRVIKKEVCS
ncbi:MAG TPA: hypothetical protein VJX93_05450 [Candidatus Methanomethylophilaceae archaeon]|nr:hypothetical protein [Candidatus Methanomethylophilaceae archaeon]